MAFRLKLTASIVNVWERGDRQELIDVLHGEWRPPTEPMEYGTLKHKEWELEVKNTGRLPEIFGGEKIENPKTETYHTLELDDWLKISGVIDLEYGKHGEVIVDYKTGGGSSSANQYARSLQVGFYALMRPEAKLFKFQHYNRKTGRVSTSVVHLTEMKRREWQDKIMSIACDIRSWLEPTEPDFDNWNISTHKRKDEYGKS